jgi:transcriptional regulator with XRE-family HTH domain
MVTSTIVLNKPLNVNRIFKGVFDEIESASMTERLTLGAFIQQQMDKRHMSASKFAAFVGVDPSAISTLQNHGINKTYAGKPVGNPSLETLYKLAIATKTDIGVLIGIIYPDATVEDAHALLLAHEIRKLPRSEREMVEGVVHGLAVKAEDKIR